jgi:hypothetical protein
MNQMHKILFAALTAIVLSSCQDVIDIELRDTDRKYVIEGSVIQGVDSVVVRVSRTTSFFDTSAPEAIVNAAVTLTLPDGSEQLLAHRANGYYVVHGIIATTSADYGLKVIVAGQTFKASSRMPEAVTIDSLTFRPVQSFFGPPPPNKFNVFLNFQDPMATNYYRAQYYRNGNLKDDLSDLQLFDDELTNGNYIEIPIFNQEYRMGDTADVTLLTMDGDVYTFLETFTSAASSDAGSPFSAAPDNPISNIDGGALGVFAAYARSQSQLVILP